MARFCPHMIRRSRQKLPFWISKEWIRVKERTFSDWEKSAKDSNTSGMRFKVPGSGKNGHRRVFFISESKESP